MPILVNGQPFHARLPGTGYRGRGFTREEQSRGGKSTQRRKREKLAKQA